MQQPDTAGAEAGAEVIRLYQELAARLDERGVTPEEMQAAVDAGDAERIRELFGYTAEEFDEANARVRQLAAELWHANDSTGSPSRRAYDAAP